MSPMSPKVPHVQALPQWIAVAQTERGNIPVTLELSELTQLNNNPAPLFFRKKIIFYWNEQDLTTGIS